MKNIINDKRGVSPILGFMLVAAIVISMLTYTQVYSVPVWNTEIEFGHIDAVYDDMMHVASDIEDVAISGVPKSSVIQLGVEYPSRALFRNPRKGMVGTISVEPDQTITITYTMTNDVKVTETYPSCSLRYTAFGTTMLPTFVYEHGIVIRDYGEYGNATTCEQTLIVDDGIYIPVLNGTNKSVSSLDIESLSLYPYTETITTTEIEYVNITLTTNYPVRWKELLADVNTSKTNATVSGNRIYINSTATKRILSPKIEPPTYAGIYIGMLHFSTTMGATPAGTQIDLGSDYPKMSSPCIYDGKGQDNCGDIKKQTTYVNVTATIYNAPNKDEVYADLTMITNTTTYGSDPVYAWTLNMSSPGNIITSYPEGAFDEFPNEFTATWTIDDMNYINNEADNGQMLLVTMWVTNSSSNQQYVTYALAVISTSK